VEPTFVFLTAYATIEFKKFAKAVLNIDQVYAKPLELHQLKKILGI
jgi:hypothetical protein